MPPTTTRSKKAVEVADNEKIDQTTKRNNLKEQVSDTNIEINDFMNVTIRTKARLRRFQSEDKIQPEYKVNGMGVAKTPIKGRKKPVKPAPKNTSNIDEDKNMKEENIENPKIKEEKIYKLREKEIKDVKENTVKKGQGVSKDEDGTNTESKAPPSKGRQGVKTRKEALLNAETQERVDAKKKKRGDSKDEYAKEPEAPSLKVKRAVRLKKAGSSTEDESKKTDETNRADSKDENAKEPDVPPLKVKRAVKLKKTTKDESKKTDETNRGDSKDEDVNEYEAPPSKGRRAAKNRKVDEEPQKMANGKKNNGDLKDENAKEAEAPPLKVKRAVRPKKAGSSTEDESQKIDETKKKNRADLKDENREVAEAEEMLFKSSRRQKRK